MFSFRSIIDWFNDYVLLGQRITRFEDIIVQNYKTVLTGNYIGFKYSKEGFFFINEAERQKSKKQVNIMDELTIKQRIEETKSTLTRSVWVDIYKRAQALREILRKEGFSCRGI